MRRNKSNANISTVANKDLSSIADTTTALLDTSSSNLVNVQENKIRNLLKELQNLVKNCEVSNSKIQINYP
jgi:hypothetical protein